MDCRGDPWIMVIFGWLRQNTPFYYYSRSTELTDSEMRIPVTSMRDLTLGGSSNILTF